MPALLAAVAYFLLGWLASWPLPGSQSVPAMVQAVALVFFALVVAAAMLLTADMRGLVSRLMLVAAVSLFTVTYAVHWPAFYRLATHPEVPGELFLAFVIIGPMVLVYTAPVAASFRTR